MLHHNLQKKKRRDTATFHDASPMISVILTGSNWILRPITPQKPYNGVANGAKALRWITTCDWLCFAFSSRVILIPLQFTIAFFHPLKERAYDCKVNYFRLNFLFRSTQD